MNLLCQTLICPYITGISFVLQEIDDALNFLSTHVCRYPPWLEANGSSLSAPERERYTQQYRYVCEVCRLYDEDKGDDGGGSETRTKIMDVLQRMQECGQPPQELVRI